MRSLLAVAALGSALLTAPAWGQRRGGMAGSFGGHVVIASHGPGTGMHGPLGGVRAPAIGLRPAGGGRAHPGFHPGLGHPHHFPWWWCSGSPWWGCWGSPSVWGWGWAYPWAYVDLGSYDNRSYADQYEARDSHANEYQSNEIQRQQTEIDRLNDEVANLREEREARLRSNRAPQPEAKSQPTSLVFRDQRKEEVENYAIAGQTLWIFTEQRARKIPLADLDISATQRANEARGEEFAIPR